MITDAIEPGVVYAYWDEEKNTRPEPTVFLDTPASGTLYRRNPRAKGSEPRFRPVPAGTENAYTGHPAAMLRDLADDPAVLLMVTLADFHVATGDTSGPAHFCVIARLEHVLGPWGDPEVTAEVERRHQNPGPMARAIQALHNLDPSKVG